MGERYPTEVLIIRGPNGGRHVISGMDTEDVILGQTFERKAKRFNNLKDNPDLITSDDWNNKIFNTEAEQRRAVTVFNPMPSNRDRLWRNKNKNKVVLTDEVI